MKTAIMGIAIFFLGLTVVFQSITINTLNETIIIWKQVDKDYKSVVTQWKCMYYECRGWECE